MSDSPAIVDRRGPPARLRLSSGRAGTITLTAVVLLASIAPDPVPLATARLAALAVAAAGTWLIVGRAGIVDLASGSVLAVGAAAGGVGSALLGLPALVGVAIGAISGGIVGGIAGSVHGRVGRAPGALASLALGTAVVAAIATWEPLGGAGGFHAVGLPAPGGARVELLVVGAIMLLVLTAVAAAERTRAAGIAAVSVRAPELAAASGHAPAPAVARLTSIGGAALGAGGALLASVDGSVVPGAYGLELTAALVLAALLGGLPPLGPVLGVLFVWGPATILPLVPLVGTAPPLLVMGPIGLTVLLARRGRGVVGRPEERQGTGEAPVSPLAPSRPTEPPDPRPLAALPSDRRRELSLRSVATPSGPVDARVRPGGVLAVVGPNGAGKSTLLARIGGQLPDGGGVWLDGDAAPRGPVARARAGIARTWQAPPPIPDSDLAALHDGGEALEAAAWAERTLNPTSDATSTAAPKAARGAIADAAPGPSPERRTDGRRQLVSLVAARPSVALIDEPTDIPVGTLAVLIRGLASAGVAVLLVDHRAEVVALADEHLVLGGRDPASGAAPAGGSGAPARPDGGAGTPEEPGPRSEGAS